MTNREFIQRYLKCIGQQQIGENGDIAAVVPILLADLAYQAFDKDIKPIGLKHECNSIRNDWKDANEKFFHRFFRNTDQELENEIVDKMCDFEDYVSNLSFVLKTQIMNAVMDVSSDHQKVIASAQYCNILSQEAQAMWKRMYKNPIYRKVRVAETGEIANQIIGWKPATNEYFEDVRAWSRRFSNKYYKHIGGRLDVKLSTRNELTRAVDALENRIVLWIYDKRECTQ